MQPRPPSRPAPIATARGRRAAVVGCLLALVLAVTTSACASSDSASSTATSAPPRNVTVTITDGRFDPRQVVVAVGGSVTWVNHDETPHKLTATTPNVIDSPLIGQAGTYTQSFPAAGEFRYYCTIHNSMKGEVVVR